MSGVVPSTFTILTYRAFEPNEISGLKAWYDASTINQADGTSVSAWLDSSGNEAHMYQSTSAAQPTLQTNELNGRAVVRFDGTDDFMNLTAPFDVVPSSITSIHACEFSQDGNYVVHVSTISPYLFIYKKNNNIYNRLATPSDVPTGIGRGCAWSPDSMYLTIAHSTSPYITIYKRIGDTFTKLANPSTLPNATIQGVDIDSTNTYLACTGDSTPTIFIYKRSGDVFTKLANLVTNPTATAWRPKFSTNSNFLAVGWANSPYIYFYSRSGDVFTKLNDPTSIPNATCYDISWLDDQTCALGVNSSTVYIYQYNGTDFQLLTSFSNGVGSTFAISYSNSKNYLALALSASPYIKVYSVSGTTYTALSNPASLPLGAGRGVTWGLNDTSLVVSHTNSPFMQAYTFDGTTLTNLTKLNMFRNVGGASVFAVVKYGVGTAFDVTFNALTPTGTYRLYQGISDPTTRIFRSGGRRLDADVSQWVDSTTTSSATLFYIQSSVIDYSNSDATQFINAIKNGESINFQTSGNTSDTNSNLIRISGGDFFLGDIAEIIVFNRALTTQEIKNIHYYLAQKYNIPVPL